MINPVDRTQLSRYTSHRRSTTVSLETYPSTQLPVGLIAQLAEQCNGIAKVMGSNSDQACF